MSDKVVIPREVAEAVEALRSKGYGMHQFIDACAIESERYLDEEAVVYQFALENADTLMRALLDGYERELTEEENREKALAEIRDKYDCYYSGPGGYPTDDEDAAFADGIEWTLHTLGIKIEGVNG